MADRLTFTADQQRAIDARGHNILVAAAAGSGKTRVLVERIISQVRNEELSLDRILVLTFTKAAALEMRERIEAALNAEIDAIAGDAGISKEIDRLERQRILLTGADISTFHSFCQRLLQAHIDATDIPPTFRLASEQEIRLLKRDVMDELLERKYEEAAQGSSDEFLAFADAYGGVKGDDEKLKEEVLALYDFALSQPSPAVWLSRQGQEEDDLPYWKRRGFDVLARELHEKLSDLCAGYHSTMDVLVQGDAELHTVAEKYMAVIHHNLDLYEELQGGLQLLINGSEDQAWERFRMDAAAAKKQRKSIPHKSIENYDPELGGALKKKMTNIYKAWDAAVDQLPATAEELCAAENRANTAIRQYARLALDFHHAFQKEKLDRSLLDFSDLEHRVLALLCRHPEQLQDDLSTVDPTDIAEELRAYYTAIMVDEYQDTNGIQEGILRQIARDDNRFIVGDVKQSIYRFRLADPSLFQHTYRAYRQGSSAGELITMSENFRSRAEVLQPINEIFSQIMTESAVEIAYDQSARLNPGRTFDDDPAGKSLASPLEIDLLDADYSAEEADDEGEELAAFAVESRYIARRIKALVDAGYTVQSGKALRWSDIVVLLRGAKERAVILMDALREAGIPSYADDTAGYFEASEIRMMLSLLAVLDNARQDTPLTAVLTSPMVGMSMEELALLRIHTPVGSIYDALKGAAAEEVPPAVRNKAKEALQTIRCWRREALLHSVPELLWHLYRTSGYYDYVGALPDGILRQANLRMLIDRAGDFERTNERGLFRFLRYMDALQRRSTDLSAARTLGESENVVRIMTIHRSKGLEFPVVFLANIAGAFNTQDISGDVLYHAHAGIGVRVYENTAIGRQKYDTLGRRSVKEVIRRETIAEEMRILYVAMTRAQEKLILTGTLRTSRSGLSRLAQLRDFCRKYAKEEGETFPDDAILGASCYLDWIALALMRHPDGQALMEGVEGIELREWSDEKARFAVRIEKVDVRTSRSEEESAADAELSAIRSGEPLPPGTRASYVDAVLSWTYDSRGTEQIHAKTSVTELKRENFPDEEVLPSFAPAVGAGAGGQEWEVPRFLRTAKRAALSPMERGTAMHALMQHLDFAEVPDIAAIERQARSLFDQGILTGEAYQSLDVRNVWRFVSSALGRRLRAAKRVYRELPFGRLLPAKKYYKEAQDEADRIFLQGIIDVLFEEENGDYILLDYKTDRHISPKDARTRYQFQMDLYCDAVETILGRPVKECYLFLLDTGREVRMERQAASA